MQTAIKKEQLEALSSFQRLLEEYYKTKIDSDSEKIANKQEQQLYYERRTGQYRGRDIPASKIVSIPMQIKTVSAMFLDKPDVVAHSYGSIAKNLGGRIFNKDDKWIIYYVSSFALYQFENFVKNKEIDRKYRKTRFHVIMLFKYIVGGKACPQYFNSNSMETYCEKILAILENKIKCLEIYKQIIDYIVKQKGIEFTNRRIFEHRETTIYLISHLDDIIKYVFIDDN